MAESREPETENVNVLAGLLDSQNMEIIRRSISALVEGLVVVLVAVYLARGKGVPDTRKEVQDALWLGFIAGSVFALLDYFAPAVASSSRKGAGLAVGTALGGGLTVA